MSEDEIIGGLEYGSQLLDEIHSLRAKLVESETNAEVWRDNYKRVALQLEKSCPTDKLKEVEAKLAESAANEAALREASEVLVNQFYKLKQPLGANVMNPLAEALSRPPSEGAAAVRGLVEATENLLPYLPHGLNYKGPFHLDYEGAKEAGTMFKALSAAKKAGL